MEINREISAISGQLPSVKLKFNEFHPIKSKSRTQTSDQESYIDMYQTSFEQKNNFQEEKGLLENKISQTYTMFFVRNMKFARKRLLQTLANIKFSRAASTTKR